MPCVVEVFYQLITSDPLRPVARHDFSVSANADAILGIWARDLHRLKDVQLSAKMGARCLVKWQRLSDAHCL